MFCYSELIFVFVAVRGSEGLAVHESRMKFYVQSPSEVLQIETSELTAEVIRWNYGESLHHLSMKL